MDLRRLTPDELEVEFVVWQINSLVDCAMDRLMAVVELERANRQEKPTLPHPLKPSN